MGEKYTGDSFLKPELIAVFELTGGCGRRTTSFDALGGPYRWQGWIASYLLLYGFYVLCFAIASLFKWLAYLFAG